MREANGVKYPDSVAFLFSPVMFVCESGAERLEVTMSKGNDSVTVVHDAFDGACYVDMREYAQGLFGDVSMPASYAATSQSDLCQSLTYTVRKYASNAWTTAINEGVTYFVWGCPKIDEVWGVGRVVRKYTSKPFCVDLFNLGGQSFIFSDGTSSQSVTPSSIGLWHVKIPTQLESAEVLSVTDSNGEVIIKQAECEDGVMLRWIDRHGMLCHYTFIEGVRNAEIKDVGVVQRNNLLSLDGYGWKGYNGRRELKERTDMMMLGAVLEEAAIIEMLTDLPSSPMVEMWDGSDWISVRVEAGTWTRRGAALQDFECTIVFDDVAIQRA